MNCLNYKQSINSHSFFFFSVRICSVFQSHLGSRSNGFRRQSINSDLWSITSVFRPLYTLFLCLLVQTSIPSIQVSSWTFISYFAFLLILKMLSIIGYQKGPIKGVLVPLFFLKIINFSNVYFVGSLAFSLEELVQNCPYSFNSRKIIPVP